LLPTDLPVVKLIGYPIVTYIREIPLGLEGETSNQKWFMVISNLLARNPNQVLSDNLFFHLKCAKAWLNYSLESTLATTFFGAIAGDGG
jgi:hypothetical protein